MKLISKMKMIFIIDDVSSTCGLPPEVLKKLIIILELENEDNNDGFLISSFLVSSWTWTLPEPFLSLPDLETYFLVSSQS